MKTDLRLELQVSEDPIRPNANTERLVILDSGRWPQPCNLHQRCFGFAGSGPDV